MTATGSGLDYARTSMLTSSAGDRAGDPNYVIVLTDGYSNVNRDTTIPAANRLRTGGATVFVVGVGGEDDLDPLEIRGIANSPANQYSFLLFPNSTMQAVVNGILDTLCNN